MPRPYPKEFRDDVVAVTRRAEGRYAQIAKDFGIAESCLRNWVRAADVEGGRRPGVTQQESDQLRELKRRNRLLEQENEVLRRAAAYLSRDINQMIYPLVRDLAAPTALLRVPVTVACRVLGFSTQGFYKWLSSPVCQRDYDDAYLIHAALSLHGEDPEFGYRLLIDELRALGHTASENRVWRLCSLQRIASVHSRRRGTGRQPGPPVHDDLVERQFTAPRPDVLWLTDITEHPTAEGKLYLCAIKDACSRRIVGYSISDRMTSELAVAALRNALALRRPAGTIVHSDRGSSSGPASTSRPCTRPGCSARWAGSRPAPTTPPWRASSAFCRRTS